MAWVRIHDGAMGHLKIVSLTDSAFRLWVRGLSYCQTNLTDGLIPSAAVKEMGARPKDILAMKTSVLPGRSPLWEAIDGFGFKVHDYLDWNDSRETVLARQKKAKARKQHWNAKKNGVPGRVPDAVPDDDENDERTGNQTKPN